MATVSEPCWINKTQGVAARNGTTTQTIPLGFTPTLGNFLMFVVGGAVTHTNALWTVRANPVNSGGLSVFTKTSDGTETNFVDTMNGSNYPLIWTAYEFLVGTTYTTSVQANPTTFTFSQVTGLPGTAQVVFGAAGIVMPTVATTFSATWTNPLVEDSDQFAINATTDGYGMTVGHQINVMTTTFTPAVSVTTNASTGDRQMVTLALNVAVPIPQQPQPYTARRRATLW